MSYVLVGQGVHPALHLGELGLLMETYLEIRASSSDPVPPSNQWLLWGPPATYPPLSLFRTPPPPCCRKEL